MGSDRPRPHCPQSKDAAGGETPPPVHTRLIAGVGRPDHRFVLFGNRPPPGWTEPPFALPAGIIAKILNELKLAPSAVSRRLTLPKGEAASQPVTASIREATATE